jgi:hypothetical protein
MVDKVLRHFDEALRMHADALTKRMDAIEAKFKRRKDSHFDEGEEREEREEGEDKDVRLDKRRKDDGDLTLRHEGRERDFPIAQKRKTPRAIKPFGEVCS